MSTGIANPGLWSVLLLVGFPLAVLVLGEIAFRIDPAGPAARFVTPLAIVRTAVLPLGFVDLLLRHLADLPAGHLAVRLLDTGFWIVALNAAVAVLNVILFGDGAHLTRRYPIPKLLLDLLRLVVVACGAAVVVSQVWDVDLSGLLAALGVGSLVIGLALQDTLGSVFAGIAMVSARQFRVGDWIRVGGDEGLVCEMNWRSVKIRTPSGDALYLPNGSVARSAVTVLSAGAGSTTVKVELKFAADVSPDRVATLLADTARATAGFHLDPPPAPRVVAIEDDALRFAIDVRSVDPQALPAVRGDYLSNVWFAAQRAGVAFKGRGAPAEARPDPEALARTLADLGALRAGPEALRDLVRGARLERFRAGESIVAQGAVAHSAYVLASGTANATFASPAGAAIVVHSFERGQLLLAKALLTATGMPFSFKAGTEVEVIAIPAEHFKALCAHDPPFARDVEEMLAAREAAAARTLRKALPADDDPVGVSDRAQLLRELFRS